MRRRVMNGGTESMNKEKIVANAPSDIGIYVVYNDGTWDPISYDLSTFKPTVYFTDSEKSIIVGIGVVLSYKNYAVIIKNEQSPPWNTYDEVMLLLQNMYEDEVWYKDALTDETYYFWNSLAKFHIPISEVFYSLTGRYPAFYSNLYTHMGGPIYNNRCWLFYYNLDGSIKKATISTYNNSYCYYPTWIVRCS